MTPSQDATLPLELIDLVFQQLDDRSLWQWALVCRSFCPQARRRLFEEIEFSGLCSLLLDQIQRLHRAPKEIKQFVRRLVLGSGNRNYDDDITDDLCKLLKTLSNLQCLDYYQLRPLIHPGSGVPPIVRALKHTKLSHLILHLHNTAPVAGNPRAGPVNLSKLHLFWHAGDRTGNLGSSARHMKEFIRPSFATLVELELVFCPHDDESVLDLRLLKDVGNTLRNFQYVLQSGDASILKIVPDVFPHLTKLGIQWWGTSIHWKDEYLNSLSKNTNLVELTLSCDFEGKQRPSRERRDINVDVKVYIRQLQTTRDICGILKKIKFCIWSSGAIFVVTERNGVEVEVKGTLQDWMGDEFIAHPDFEGDLFIPDVWYRKDISYDYSRFPFAAQEYLDTRYIRFC